MINIVEKSQEKYLCAAHQAIYAALDPSMTEKYESLPELPEKIEQPEDSNQSELPSISE